MRTMTKTFVVFLSLTGIVFTASSQVAKKKQEPVQYDAPKMPIDEVTKLITYTGVVEVQGPADTLYKKALNWLTDYYVNPTNVIRERNTQEKKIVCKYWFEVKNPPDEKGVQTPGATVMYTFRIFFRDGRYKYEFTEMRRKGSSVYPLEKWLDPNDPGYSNVFNFYLTQVDEKIKEEAKKFEKGMKYVKPVKNDNW